MRLGYQHRNSPISNSKRFGRTRSNQALTCPLYAPASSPNAGETDQRRWLSFIRVNGISNTDVSIGEDVGAKSTAMYQWAQNALCCESLQVSAWLAQTLSKTLDVANSESPSEQAVEIDAPGDQVPARFAVLEPTATR
jgi:hypothetical protein